MRTTTAALTCKNATITISGLALLLYDVQHIPLCLLRSIPNGKRTPLSNHMITLVAGKRVFKFRLETTNLGSYIQI